MAKHCIKIPPRPNMHGMTTGTNIILSNRHFLDTHPNAFQHEIAIKPDGCKYFPIMAITNLDHAKVLQVRNSEFEVIPWQSFASD